MKERAHLIWGLILGAIAALGTIKTLVTIATGSEFSLQKIAFYLGTTTFYIYIGAATAIAFAAVLFLVGKLLVGEDRAEERLGVPIMMIAGALGLLFAGYLTFSAGYQYEELDSVGRGAGALLGLAAIAGTIYMFRRSGTSQPTEE